VGVSSQVLEALRQHAARAHPRECCGLLLGQGTTIATALPAANVHPAPQTHFEIDPQALVDAHRQARSGGPQVLGHYHSHPTGAIEPSATDRAQAAQDGVAWAIVAGDAIGWWLDAPDGFTRLPYATIEA